MSDMKEFLERKQEIWRIKETDNPFPARKGYIAILDLGLFFWERGGKYFQYLNWELKDAIKEAEEQTNEERKDDFHNLNDFEILYAQDFLDCLACLGEDKVKELIEELKK